MAIIDLKKQPEPGFFSDQIRTARRFFKPEVPNPRSEGPQVVSGGMEICIPGYRVHRNDFSYWAVELVSSGRGTLKLNNRNFELLPGSVYSYGPGVRHQISADRGEALEKYFIDIIPGSGIQSVFSEVRNQLFETVLYSNALESLKRTFEEITEYGSSPSPGSTEICSRLFEILLLKIMDTATQKNINASSAFEAYRKCRIIIENRYLDLVTVQAVADEAHMDVSYLCRLFKKFDTRTPYTLLTGLRMNHAAGMLIRDGMNVKEVALELGYDSPFTFSRRFRNTMGISPQKFTNKHRTTKE